MNKNVNDFYVKHALFLSDFNETWIFSTDFSKNPGISSFMKNRPVGAELFHADGHDEADSRFSQFCEHPWNATYQTSSVSTAKVQRLGYRRIFKLSGLLCACEDKNTTVFQIVDDCLPADTL